MDDLSAYRLSMAEEKLYSSKILLDAGQYKDSIGRSYYAIFSAVRAVLAKDKVDFSKHAGVISYFQREYIKTEIFDKKYSKYITIAFQIRNNCDYDDFLLYLGQMQLNNMNMLRNYMKQLEYIYHKRCDIKKEPD